MSLELALASLQPQSGILSLSKDKAQQLIQQRKSEYRKTIQIEVYWFEGNGLIAGPSARTRLHIADSTYRPTQQSHGPLRTAFMHDEAVSTYRRNSFTFLGL